MRVPVLIWSCPEHGEHETSSENWCNAADHNDSMTGRMTSRVVEPPIVQAGTDRERLVDCLDALGVPYTEKVETHRKSDDQGRYVSNETVTVLVLSISVGLGAPVNGYSGFSCDWEFDLDGKFREVGVWE